jgi:two-component system, chemotaxis family, sensor kinase CheA
LHTLKGVVSTLGIVHLAQLVHEIEERVVQNNLSDEDRMLLRHHWKHIEDRLVDFQALKNSPEENKDEEIKVIAKALKETPGTGHIVQRLEQLTWESTAPSLERLAQQARDLAKQLHREHVKVVVEPGETRLPNSFADMWSVMQHVIRNAVDHGIDSPEERARLHKSPLAHIRLASRLKENGIELVVSDDGRGIDFDALIDKAKAVGHAIASRDDVLKLLFSGGLSSKKSATEISGRGQGLHALYAAVKAHGGQLNVQSERGFGTTFTLAFALPS